MTDTKEIMCNLIEATEHPLAPVIVQQLADALKSAGPVLSGLTDIHAVGAMQERILGHIPEAELNQISSDPTFLLAILAIAAESLPSVIGSIVVKAEQTETNND